MTAYSAEHTHEDGSIISAGPGKLDAVLLLVSSAIATKYRRDGGTIGRLHSLTHPHEGLTCGMLDAVKGLTVHVAVYDVD